jgi:predicted porin
MKKTLVALAALAATASFAQVTLSGRASMDISTYEATGSTGGATFDLRNRTRVADTASRITFAANEDLGGGLKAGVYCETGLNIDNANIAGQANADNSNTQTWCSREGRAYFGNDNVEVRLGRQNVWWTQGELNQIGSTFLGSDSGTNLINGGSGVYTVRGENMIKLTAGNGMGALAGSEVYMGYMGASGSSTTQANGAQGEAAAANTDASGKYQGFKAQYTAGNIVGMIDYQASKSQLIKGAAVFDRTAIKYGLAYKYSPTSLVSAQYWSKKRTDQAGSGVATTNVFGFNTATWAALTAQNGDASDTGYSVLVKHDLGNTWMLHGQYSKANNIKDNTGASVANTGASAVTLGATKSFSKRTHMYGAYHVINNNDNAAYNMTGGSYNSGTSNLGADVKMFSLGMIHNF